MINKIPQPNALNVTNSENKEKRKRVVLLEVNGKVEVFDRDSFLKDYRVDGIIRIHDDEFEDIDQSSDLYDHFNLKESHHEEGKKYLLMKIKQAGTNSALTKKWREPLLSPDGALIARCDKVEEDVPYDNLTPEHQTHSMKGAKDIPSLQARILRRYRKSRSELTDEQMLAMGVGYTRLRILGPAPALPADLSPLS